VLTGPQAYNDSETGTGADSAGTVTAHLSDADAGHGTDGGESGTGNVTRSDSDSCHAEDSAFHYITDSDANGATAEGASFRPSDADASGKAAEAEWSRWPRDADSGGATAEKGGWSGPLSDADAGHSADAGERMRLADAGAYPAGDSGLLTDSAVPVVDIFTFVPYWDESPGGGLVRIVWTHPVTGEKRAITPAFKPEASLLRLARELGRAKSVQFPSDADAGRAEDRHSHALLGVAGEVAPALEVTGEVSW
jgi:hypothetical protein